MADESPSTEALTDAKKIAETKLQEGKKLIDDDPEKAVELLCEAVRASEKVYGAEALESAPAYLYYGIALYEVARLSTDALGTAKTTVTKSGDSKKGAAGTSVVPADGSAPKGSVVDAADTKATSPSGRVEAEGTADGEGARGADADGKAEGGAQGGDGKGNDHEEGPEAKDDAEAGGGEDGEGEEVTDDMKLAWEMVELARLIFSKHPPEQHQSMLAEVHKALGDISSEQEQFEEAAKCYELSINHLKALQPPSRRRVAEVQYKLSVILTYLDHPKEALEQTEAAMASLEEAVAEIEDELSSLPQDGSGGEEVEQQGRLLQDTADDLRSIMTELTLNCEGLKETIAANNSFKEVFKQAVIKVATGAESVGTALARLSDAAAAGPPSRSAPAAERVSLGVVGRGTKRITAVPAGGASAQPVDALPGAMAGSSAPAAKRTLADLMGGAPIPGGGGFGAVAVVEKRAETEPQVKKSRVEEEQPSSAPSGPEGPAVQDAEADGK